VAGRFAYYQSAIFLNPEEKSNLMKIILDPQGSGYALKDCIKVFEYLSGEFPEHLVEYKEKCHSLFPYSSFFGAATTCRVGPLILAENKPENNEQ